MAQVLPMTFGLSHEHQHDAHSLVYRGVWITSETEPLPTSSAMFSNGPAAPIFQP
jgi:hypothetical protein